MILAESKTFPNFPTIFFISYKKAQIALIKIINAKQLNLSHKLN